MGVVEKTQIQKSKSTRKVQATPVRNKNILRGVSTGWIFFCKSKRAEAVLANPHVSLGEVCKQVAPIWKGMTVKQKKPYHDLHLQDKQRFKEEFQGLPIEDKKRMKINKKAKKDLKKLKPKQSLSAYMFFVIDTRPKVLAENPNIDFRGIGRLLGENWKQLDAAQKARFVEMSRVDKERQLQEIQVYNAKSITA